MSQRRPPAPAFDQFAAWAQAASQAEQASGLPNPLLSMLGTHAQAPLTPDDCAFMVHNAKFEQDKGNHQMRQNKFLDALESYTHALHIICQVPGQEDMVAKLLSNRSLVQLKVSNYKAAMEDAIGAINVQPRWHKGYWRQAKVFVAWCEFGKAVDSYLECCLQCRSIMDADDMVETLKEVIIYSVKISPDYMYQHKMGNMNHPAIIWSQVLSRLAKGNFWYHIALLVLGLHKNMPIIRTCPAQGIELAKLLTVGIKNLQTWGVMLLIRLMQWGANPQSFSMEGPKPALHIAMETCLNIGHTALLEYLLKDHYSNPEAAGIRDPTTGNTILHLACIFPGNQAFRMHTIKVVLKHGVDPLTKNKGSKTAVECFIARDAACERILQQAMEEKRMADPAVRLQTCREEASRLKECRDYSRAVGKLNEALALVDSKVPARTKAELYHDRAEAYKLSGDLHRALRDARESEKMDKKWIKSQMLLADIFMRQKNFSKAVNALEAAFNCTEKTDVRIYILSQLLELGSTMGIDVQSTLKSMNPSAHLRRETTIYLLNKKKKLKLHVAASIGFMDRCDLSGIDYFAAFRDDFNEPHIQQFLTKVLLNGGEIKYLDMPKFDTPFHVSVLMFMFCYAKSMDEPTSRVVMEIVLKKEPTLLNKRSSTGDTALHMVAKFPTPLVGDDAKGIVIFALYCQKKADPTLLDAAGWRASWYVEDIPHLQQAMIQFEEEYPEQSKSKSGTAKENAQPKKKPTSGSRKAKRDEPEQKKVQHTDTKETKKPSTNVQRKGKSESHAGVMKQEKMVGKPTGQNNQPKTDECIACLSKLESTRILIGKEEWIKAVEKIILVIKSDHEGARHRRAAADARLILFANENLVLHAVNKGTVNELVILPWEDVRSCVNLAANCKKWSAVQKLLVAYVQKVIGGDSSIQYPRECLAKKDKGRSIKANAKKEELAGQVNLTAFVRSGFESNFQQNRCQLLELLLKLGASPEAIGVEVISPLAACVAEKDYPSMCMLLMYGAAPSGLCADRDQQPLQVALQIALTGKREPLELLFRLYDEFEDPCLAPNLADKDGNTLFHFAATANYSNHALKVVELLCNNGYNPNLRNNYDQNARMCLKKGKDRRMQYIRQQGSRFNQVPAKLKPSQPKFEVPPESIDAHAQDLTDIEPRQANEQHYDKSPKAMTKDKALKSIKSLIEELPDYEQKVTMKKSDSSFASTHDTSVASTQNESITEETRDGHIEGNVIVNEEAMVKLAVETNVGDEETDLNDSIRVEPSMFDDLDWEVECTSDVWKTLQDRRVNSTMKQKIILTVQQLASGEWSQRLCKKLKGAPETMQLFESKLSRDSRLLWELAIAFSPRRSETAERRLGLESGEQSGAKGGRIYSEIIRVWDIVLAHDHIQRSVERISKSHKRGQDCIINKKLKGIDRRQFASGNYVEKKLPMLFTEDEEIIDETSPESFFPPASSKETEYHIMKFYSFTSALVNNIFSEQAGKVDFPFKVTDLEHAIINLRPKPPCTILLLGRSGTGKTTCCLYRLWSSFIKYWDCAFHANGEPLIPRAITFLQNKDEEEETTASGEEEENEQTLTLEEIIKKKAAEERQDTDDDLYDHIHQVFITKNAVLCSEVQKTFRELSHAHTSAAQHVEVEELPLPLHLQDAHPAAFPLFITSNQFLMLLDGSLPGDSFFLYNEDGTMARQVRGWNDGNGPLTFIPDMEEEDDEEEDMEEEAEAMLDEEAAAGGVREKVKKDPRRHVTYEVFANELWTNLNNKEKLDYHPSLVWMEITSFILGSVEALNSDEGYLTEEEYGKLGKKRAPNFSGDRSKIYSVFQRYKRMKGHRGLFDESDLIHNLFKRIQQREGLDWVIHEIYVDETQDFTQAELSLLIQCSQNPNNLFFTGDTAQSIMRGIAFRFEDLKSLFYYARQSMTAVGKSSTLQVPKNVYQLTHNYRSHAGILRLANSVVDLMVKFFPDSFDRLKPDQGLFEGPRPVLLESYSFSDLAVLLSGSKRKTSSPIEFGAHQAILVANDEARDQLPPELSTALVLTIFESKGLEFDDVLLYNFFKDSPAQKEWRVVTKHLDELVQNAHQATAETGNLQTIDISQVETENRPRPLDFDAEKHKVLNSELKYLYTAITRARVNVWLFDESQEARAPLFEYFRVRGLVQCILPGEDMEDMDGDNTEKMFTSKSTPGEWNMRGDEFYRRNLFNVAAKCFLKGGDNIKWKMSIAQQRAVDAGNKKGQPKVLRELFTSAALEFLECNMVVEAARCLYNAKEILLAAQAYEKLGQFHHAAKLYLKIRRAEDTSRCYEQLLDFRQAVEQLVNADLYDKAIDAVERYHMKVTEEQDEASMRKLSKYSPKTETHSIKRLSLRSATHYHKQNSESSKEAMFAALDRLPDEKDKVDFLMKYKYSKQAYAILKKQGRGLEIAKKLREEGHFEEALQYVSETENPQFRGECFLALARHQMLPQNRANNDDSSIKRFLIRAKDLLTDELDKIEAGVMLCDVLVDTKDLQPIRDKCKTNNYLVGEVTCYGVLFKLKPEKIKDNNAAILLGALRPMFSLILSLASPKDHAERKNVDDCLRYFGLKESTDKSVLQVIAKEGARFPRLPNASEHITEGRTNKEAASKVIGNMYIENAKMWVKEATDHLKEEQRKTMYCAHYIKGYSCSETAACAKQLHEKPCHGTYVQQMEVLMALIQLAHILRQGIQAAGSRNKHLEQELKLLSDQDLGQWCKAVRELVFPTWGIPWWSCSDMKSTWEFLQVRKNVVVREAMLEHMKIKLNQRDAIRRQAWSDGHLEANQVQDMMLLDEKILTTHILKEEKNFEDRYKKKQSQELGFVIGKQMTQQSSGFMYYRLYLQWIQDLHAKRNPDKALSHLCNFLFYLSRNATYPIMPSIAHAMELLEIGYVYLQAVHSCMYVVKVNLPTSYINLMNLWNAVHQRPMYAFLHHTIERGIRGPTIKTRMNQIVGHLTREFSACFNIIEDALSGNPAYLLSGEAERVLIFSLVVFVNSGTTFDVEEAAANRVLDALSRVDVSEENAFQFPPRLVEALNSLATASTKQEIAMILVKLLNARCGEELHTCTWSIKHHRFFLFKMNLAGIEHSSFIPMENRAVSKDKYAAKGRTLAETNVSNQEEPQFMQGDTTDVALQAEQEQQSMQREYDAAKCIQRFFKRLTFCYRLHRGLRSLLGSTGRKYKVRLQDFLDSSMCLLCGVTYHIKIEETNEDQSSDNVDGIPLLPKAAPTRLSLQKAHEETSGHKQNLLEFKLYEKCLNTAVSPMLTQVDSMIEKCKLVISTPGHSSSDFLAEELQKVEDQKGRVRQEADKIVQKRQWGTLGNLYHELGDMQKIAEECWKILKETEESQEQAQLQEENAKKELGEDHEILDADKDEEDVDDKLLEVHAAGRKNKPTKLRGSRDKKNKQNKRTR